jgi:hypothetical protein
MGAFLSTSRSTSRVLSESEVNTAIRHLSSIDGIDPPISDKQCQDIRMIIEKGNPGHVLTLLRKCYFKIGTQQRTDSFNKIINEGSSFHNFELLTVWTRHGVLSEEGQKRWKLLELLNYGQSKEYDLKLPDVLELLDQLLGLSDQLFAAAVKRLSRSERIEFLKGYCREVSLRRLEIVLVGMGFGWVERREFLKELGRGDAPASMDEDYD